eukprot:764081-Hanusia_phi.AAC.1
MALRQRWERARETRPGDGRGGERRREEERGGERRREGRGGEGKVVRGTGELAGRPRKHYPPIYPTPWTNIYKYPTSTFGSILPTRISVSVPHPPGELHVRWGWGQTDVVLNHYLSCIREYP